MSQKISRREVAKRGVAALASVALPSALMAQEPAKPPDPVGLDQELQRINKDLAKPLSPEAEKLTREAVKGIRQSSQDRLKFKLPENSEPCTRYIAVGADERGKR